MHPVQPKKSLGQHFLADRNIAAKIVSSLTLNDCLSVLEIGPGTGILTSELLSRNLDLYRLVEVDRSSVDYLLETYPQLTGKIYLADVLQTDLGDLFPNRFAVIGNLPYNISSQIFFRILDYRQRIPEAVFMIQKEVAVRLASPPGSRNYGILSVILQAYYNIEYLFTVPPHVFIPPPKVQSAVIRLTRNNRTELPCSHKFFVQVVKTAFNQRRKTLRNSLKSILLNLTLPVELEQKRPEQLGVEEFINLALFIRSHTDPQPR